MSFSEASIYLLVCAVIALLGGLAVADWFGGKTTRSVLLRGAILIAALGGLGAWPEREAWRAKNFLDEASSYKKEHPITLHDGEVSTAEFVLPTRAAYHLTILAAEGQTPGINATDLGVECRVRSQTSTKEETQLSDDRPQSSRNPGGGLNIGRVSGAPGDKVLVTIRVLRVSDALAPRAARVRFSYDVVSLSERGIGLMLCSAMGTVLWMLAYGVLAAGTVRILLNRQKSRLRTDDT